MLSDGTLKAKDHHPVQSGDLIQENYPQNQNLNISLIDIQNGNENSMGKLNYLTIKKKPQNQTKNSYMLSKLIQGWRLEIKVKGSILYSTAGVGQQARHLFSLLLQMILKRH